MAKINLDVPGKITDKSDYIEFYFPDKTQTASEDSVQIGCVEYRRHHAPDLLAFHCPNEGQIPVQYRVKMGRKGLLPGVSDEIIFQPVKGFTGVAIEIKRATKSLSSKVSDSEREFLRKNRERGGFSCVAYGVASYVQVLKYLDLI